MNRVTAILFFLLTFTTCQLSAQSNFALPKVAQKKHVSQPAAKQVVKREEKSSASGKAKDTNAKSETPQEKPLDQLSNYELQLKASHGNPQAQYLLGRQCVMRGDSVGEELGLNWIRRSAGNGNVKAKEFLRTYRRKW